MKGVDAMPLSAGEKIKVILSRRNMTITQLAEKTGQTRQNLTNKFNRDNFSEQELLQIAEVLNCEFVGTFKMKDTNEII